MLLWTLSAGPVAAAEPWSRALAAETDTAVVFTPAALLRGPFHLAGAETLWAAAPGERLSRVRVSPSGARIAWLSTLGERDVTSLWVSDSLGTGRLAVFRSPAPSDAGALRYAAPLPTRNDLDVRGARLLDPMRGASTHALAFRPGDEGVWFATRDGIGAAPPDTGRARLASPAIAIALRALDPAPVLLAEVLRLGESSAPARREGTSFSRDPAGGTTPGDSPTTFEEAPRRGTRAELGQYLLYPVANDLHAFPAGGLDLERSWAASPGTVWWAQGNRVLAITAGDPTVRPVVEDRDDVVWLAWDPARRALLRASGSRVTARSEVDGAETTLFATGARIRAVLETQDGSVRGMVAGDSLVLWNAVTDQRSAVRPSDGTPEQLVSMRDGTIVVATRPDRKPLRFWRVAGGALVSLEAPTIKNARLAASPGGGALFLWGDTTRPPRTLHVWRVAAPGWIEVENPGVIGWEPLAR
jgi:hypothetical protein